MKSLLLLLLVSFIETAGAATYYFSSVSGDDSRSSSEAKNPATPWKTLGKLNAVFSNLQPGDMVLLKRGDIFYGSIIVNKSGSSGSPITIGAYGSGEKPVITSFISLKDWSSNGSYKGVYESSNTSLGSAVNMVILNGEVQELGRYPNSDAPNKGYLTIDSHEGKTSITDHHLSSNINWTGAELVLRAKRWAIDRAPITSQSGNTIFYTPSTKYETPDKSGYFIQNDIKTLDKRGEWYYDPSSKKLSVFTGKNNPSSFTIQASSIDNLISSSNNSNIVFDNLQVTGANVCGFLIKNGSNINIKNCDILFSGRDGARIVNNRNIDIENCTVVNSNNNGIDLGFSGSDNATIRNNVILNTSVFAGMAGTGDGKGLGIQSNGSRSIIEYNEIRNTGFVPLFFNGNNVTVKNNFIDSFCITKDDGGGIYSFTGYPKPTFSGRKIIGNIVLNGVGAEAGAGGSGWGGSAADGIYMDNNSAGVEIRDNTVANCSNQGIFIQSSHEIVIQNNTVFNCMKKLLSMVELPNHPEVRNCVVADNIFFSTTSSPAISSLKSYTNDINLFGKFNNNYYVRPSDEKMQNLLDKVREYESDAKISSINGSAVRFEYNATKENKTLALNGSYADIKNNSYSNTVVLKPYSSIILLKGRMLMLSMNLLKIV